jgi:hypothetical protein
VSGCLRPGRHDLHSSLQSETGHGPAEEFGPPDASIEEHDHAVGPRQGEDKAGHTATAAEVEDPGGRLDGD